MAIDSRPGLVYSIAGPFLWEMRRPGHSRRCVLLKELLTLFLTFAKVGVMTFGGGYAMLPILQREVVENKGWATDEELTDYFAIGQCTPGVIAVNTATFIGQKRRGILGGIVATLGVVFPSLVIIAALAGVITTFSHLAWVQHAFAGIRVCVCVLIFNAVLKLWKGAVKDVWGLVIFLVILALSVFTKLSPIIYVLAAAVAGLLIKNLGAKRS
jgi:chromate transporter